MKCEFAQISAVASFRNEIIIFLSATFDPQYPVTVIKTNLFVKSKKAHKSGAQTLPLMLYDLFYVNECTVTLYIL